MYRRTAGGPLPAPPVDPAQLRAATGHLVRGLAYGDGLVIARSVTYSFQQMG
jgi:hypothetical protein